MLSTVVLYYIGSDAHLEEEAEAVDTLESRNPLEGPHSDRRVTYDGHYDEHDFIYTRSGSGESSLRVVDLGDEVAAASDVVGELHAGDGSNAGLRSRMCQLLG